MLNSRIDLFDQKWIDTIFEGRNKSYGAYDLRRRESRMTIRALIIGAVIFSFLISLPLIIKELEKTIGGAQRVEVIDKVVEVIDLPPPERLPDAVIPPAPPVREVKTKQDMTRFTSLVVTTDENVTETVATQEELKNVRAGARDLEGQVDGEIVIDGRAVEHDVDKSITEYGDLYPFTSVEVQPTYPGGIPKFQEFLINELQRYTEYESRDIRLELEFVIERDGSLTNIKIVNDGGNPRMANRAKDALLKAKKWSPGLNNGVPVRVTFSVPISIKITS